MVQMTKNDLYITKAEFRRWIAGAAIGYGVIFLGSVGMYLNGQSVSSNERGAIIQSGDVVAVVGCNRDFESIGSQRGLLIRARAAIQDAKISSDEKAAAVQFYSDELAKLQYPDCRKAKDILTSDPDGVFRPPVPLWKNPEKTSG